MVSSFEDRKCPEGYRKCGPDNNPAVQTCIADIYDCPIIDIVYEDSGNEELLQNYVEVDLSDGKSIYYSTSTNNGGLPISELTLSEDALDDPRVCINNEDNNIAKGREIYRLLNTNFFRGCVDHIDGIQYDQRWKPLLRVTEKDIYDTNQLFQNTLNRLPGFVDDLDLTQNILHLFYRPYINWDDK